MELNQLCGSRDVEITDCDEKKLIKNQYAKDGQGTFFNRKWSNNHDCYNHIEYQPFLPVVYGPSTVIHSNVRITIQLIYRKQSQRFYKMNYSKINTKQGESSNLKSAEIEKRSLQCTKNKQIGDNYVS